MADEERGEEPDEGDVIELIASVQRAGEERGKRIYFRLEEHGEDKGEMW